MPSISLHLFTSYCGLNQSTFHASPLAITALPGGENARDHPPRSNIDPGSPERVTEGLQ
jgi:hypothetical protein